MQLTQQTRIYFSKEEELKIEATMEQVGKFYRTCFNKIWQEKGLTKETYLTLKKKTFCEQFYLGTKQANCLIREAKAKVEFFQEMLCYTQVNLEQKIAELKKEEVKITNQLTKIKDFFKNKKNSLAKKEEKDERKAFSSKKEDKLINLSFEEYEKSNKDEQKLIYQILKSKLWKNKRKQEKTISKINKIKNNPTITFGSKENQKLLSRNKITLTEWQGFRNNFIYGIGESDVKYGNNIIKVIDENTLQIEGLNLEKIKIKTKIRNKHYEAIKEEVKRTARIIRKVKQKNNKISVKYYLQSQIDLTEIETQLKEKIKTKKLNKEKIHYVGIDLNKNFFSVYSTTGIKQDSFWKNYLYNENFENYNSSQRENNLRNLLNKMFKELKDNKLCNKKVDIVRIEDLSFTSKKNKNLGKKMNKMLHDLPYKMFKNLISILALKNNMLIELVNPAYSSQKVIKQGMDRHLGAAKIIAYGNQEKIIF